jgi:hypothetical protein
MQPVELQVLQFKIVLEHNVQMMYPIFRVLEEG